MLVTVPAGAVACRTVELTEDSLAELRKHLRGSDVARRFDLVDLVDALSGLGCRIGELLALDWTKIDAEAETLAIEGTVVRIPVLALSAVGVAALLPRVGGSARSSQTPACFNTRPAL